MINMFTSARIKPATTTVVQLLPTLRRELPKMASAIHKPSDDTSHRNRNLVTKLCTYLLYQDHPFVGELIYLSTFR